MHLDIGLGAFHLETEPAREKVGGGAIVGAGDTQVIDALDQSAAGGRRIERGAHTHAHAAGGGGSEAQLFASIESRAGDGVRLRNAETRQKLSGLRRGDGDVVHAGVPLVAEEGIVAGENSQRGRADAEERHRATVRCACLAPAQGEALLEHLCRGIRIAHRQRHVGEAGDVHDRPRADPATTPSASSRAISSAARPKSPSTASLCSPSIGG